MERSQSRVTLSLAAGLGGAAASFVGICIVGALLLFSIQWGEEARLLPPMLAIGLAIAAIVALVNGAIWFILVRKETSYRVLWMFLSLACTLATPFVAPLVVAMVGSGPQWGDVLCICGAPVVLVGLFVLAFRLSLPRLPATAEQEEKTGHPEPGRPTTRKPGRGEPTGAPLVRVQEDGHSLPTPLYPDQVGSAEAAPSRFRGCLGGLGTFGLGLAVPCLTAGAIVLLLYLVTILLLDAQAIVPTHGLPRHLTEVLAAVYPLLAPVAASVASLIVSLVLLATIVAPRIPSRAGKIINTILFSLLSAALGLLFGFAVVARLLTQYYPGWWR